MNLKLKALFISLPLAFTAIFLTLAYKPPFEFKPFEYNGKAIHIEAYDDSISKGDSKIYFHTNKDSSTLSYKYYIGTKHLYPYAGIMLNRIDSSFFDFSGYSHVSIRIKADKGKRIPFYLFSKIPKLSNWKSTNTFLNAQYFLETAEQEQTIDIKLSEYIVPDWWYRLHGWTVHDQGTLNLEYISFLNFANCSTVEPGQSDEVTISKIVFYKDLTPHAWICAIFLLLYYIIFFVYDSFRKQHEKLIQVLNQNPQAIEGKIDTDIDQNYENEQVFDYIKANYTNPDLSITEVETHTGVSERKISTMIKDSTDLNFKQFLNYLRITEAKQLLLETDMRISEIAFKTGYNNVSHFNRVFKSMVNTFPSDFRQKK